MKTLFLSLMLVVGLSVSASESTIFHDQDSNLSIEIPNGFKKVQATSNSEMSFSYTIFLAEAEESGGVIGIGTVPLVFSPGNLEKCKKFLLSLLSIEDRELVCDLQVLPSYENSPYETSKFRLQFSDEYDHFLLDVFVIAKEDCSNFVVVGMGSEQDWDLRLFSDAIFSGIQFDPE